MKIVIAGGTGFIGKNLVQRLVNAGHSVIVLSRRETSAAADANDKVQHVRWDGKTTGAWSDHFRGAEVIINLAGEPIAGKRWTLKQKEKIIQSRIAPTKALVTAIQQASPRPGLLLNASAVGYYGSVEKGEVYESSPPGTGFLADTCVKWEREAARTSDLGVRVVMIRTGVVLSMDGGALPRFLFPFRIFAGGHLGAGSQWMPWIHVDDLIEALMFIISNNELYGPFNAVSPEPVTMRKFAKVLGKVIRRPAWMPVPSFLLRLMLGEMSYMLLTGQKAIPKKLIDSGFRFRFNRLDDALANLLKM